MRNDQAVVSRLGRLLVGGLCTSALVFLIYLSLAAPEHLSEGLGPGNWMLPADSPPFGTDERGRPLLEYAQQGAYVVVGPAICAALLVSLFAIVGGVLRAIGWTMLDTCVQVFAEIVNALPRLVPVLIVALGSMSASGTVTSSTAPLSVASEI